MPGTTIITSPTLTRRRPTKHPKYYLNGGDLHLLVQGHLFRVHSYFFDRDSTKFLPVPNCGHLVNNKGDSDDTPIVVDVDPIKFEKLLWVFYNPTYSLYDASVEDWVDILELAHEWSFTQAKRLAIRELQKMEIPTTERIALYQRYKVDCEFLVPLYAELCMRSDILSFEEADAIGLPAAIIIFRVREEIRTPPPTATALPNMDQRDVWRRIADAFDFPPEAADGPAISRNNNRSPLNGNGRTSSSGRASWATRYTNGRP